MELISIIIPVFNVEKYLKSCIDSLLRQTYKDFEIILIDDGSKDNSPAICDDYAQKDLRVRVFHKQNQGVSQARNDGIRHSKGKYIMFVDSDDTLDFNAVETVYSNIENNDVCLFKYKRFFNEDYEKIIEKSLTPKIYNKVNIFNEIIINFFKISTDEKCIIGTSCRGLYKKELLTDNGIIFKDISYREDLLFMTEILLSAKSVKVIDNYIYNYRVNPMSVTSNKICNIAEKNKKFSIYLNEILSNYGIEKKKAENINKFIIISDVLHELAVINIDLGMTYKETRLFIKETRKILFDKNNRETLNYIKSYYGYKGRLKIFLMKIKAYSIYLSAYKILKK